MVERNFSMQEYFRKRIREQKPLYHFADLKSKDFKQWHAGFLAKLKELAGDFPPDVDTQPEIIAEVDCGAYIRRKVIYNTERSFTIPAWLLMPKKLKKGEKRPAVMAFHGHNNHGKDNVAGVSGCSAEREALIKAVDYNYGEFLANEGYIVLAPDSRSFGEVGDGRPYDSKRDTCNINFIKAGYLGDVLLTLNIWDMMKGLDYLASLDNVNKEKMGACGLSWGGTRTTYLAIFDRRVKAAAVMGYSTTVDDCVNRANTCGSQFFPGIYRYGDVSDTIGLIAPRPLMLQIGIDEDCFPVEGGLKCAREVQEIYKAAGAAGNLTIDLFSGGHQCHKETLLGFFRRTLPM